MRSSIQPWIASVAWNSCLQPGIVCCAVFVSQAGLSGDPKYIAFVDEAVAYAKAKAGPGDDTVALAIDRLAVRPECAVHCNMGSAYEVDEVDDVVSLLER